MSKKKAGIRHLIYLVFLRSQIETQRGRREYIPWEQGALLNSVNDYRNSERFHGSPIDNISIGRVLSKLKSEGKVQKLKWREPSSKNIWIWTGDNQT